MVNKEEILENKFEDMVEEADERLRAKANEINSIEFNENQSLGEWNKNKNLIGAIIKKSEEAWSEKKIANEQLDLINQSSLDEFEEDEEEEEEEEDEEEETED